MVSIPSPIHPCERSVTMAYPLKANKTFNSSGGFHKLTDEDKKFFKEVSHGFLGCLNCKFVWSELEGTRKHVKECFAVSHEWVDQSDNWVSSYNRSDTSNYGREWNRYYTNDQPRVRRNWDGWNASSDKQYYESRCGVAQSVSSVDGNGSVVGGSERHENPPDNKLVSGAVDQITRVPIDPIDIETSQISDVVRNNNQARTRLSDWVAAEGVGLVCSLCDVKLSPSEMFTHMDGGQHLKLAIDRLISLVEKLYPYPPLSAPFCELCAVECGRDHWRSESHIANVASVSHFGIEFIQPVLDGQLTKYRFFSMHSVRELSLPFLAQNPSLFTSGRGCKPGPSLMSKYDPAVFFPV